MKKYNINGHIIASNIDETEMARRVSIAAGSVRTICGLANNAAWACCLEALDHLKTHPAYKQNVKQAFQKAVSEFKAYERRLVYATDYRLFHLDDLTPAYRKRFGAITDREYYEYWCATGATAYAQKRAWFVSLWNKYRQSLRKHQVAHDSAVAWGMTGYTCLKLSTEIHEQSIEAAAADLCVPAAILTSLFEPLAMRAVTERWNRAMGMMEPWTCGYVLDESEERNIQLGVVQLSELLTGMDTMTDALSETAEAYDDVFRTKGEQKKALRKIAEMREE
jgi:hypothetical protein